MTTMAAFMETPDTVDTCTLISAMTDVQALITRAVGQLQQGNSHGAELLADQISDQWMVICDQLGNVRRPWAPVDQGPQTIAELPATDSIWQLHQAGRLPVYHEDLRDSG